MSFPFIRFDRYLSNNKMIKEETRKTGVFDVMINNIVHIHHDSPMESITLQRKLFISYKERPLCHKRTEKQKYFELKSLSIIEIYLIL